MTEAERAAKLARLATAVGADPSLIEDALDLIADRLADLVTGTDAAPTGKALVDLKTLAGVLGVSTDFVYDHARELGGVKTGTHWRFDVDQARDHLNAKAQGSSSPPNATRSARPGARSRRRRLAGGQSLAIRGEEA